MSVVSSISRRLLETRLQWRSLLLSKHYSNESTTGASRHDRLMDPEFNTDSSNTSSKLTMISLQEDDNIYITKYSPFGFTLNNGVKLLGPTAFFPNTCFSWKVASHEGIHEGSLSLFTMIEPKPDLLVLGTGTERKDISIGLVKYLRKHKINFEVLPTPQAIATFNFQNNDQRWVVAGLIPPEPSRADMAAFARRRIEAKLDLTDLQDDLEGPDSSVDESIEGDTDVKSKLSASGDSGTTGKATGADPVERSSLGARSPLGSGLMLGDVVVVEGRSDQTSENNEAAYKKLTRKRSDASDSGSDKSSKSDDTSSSRKGKR